MPMLPNEIAFEEFMKEPEITLFMDGMKPDMSESMHELMRNVLKCAYMEGMLYAQRRCDAEGH